MDDGLRMWEDMATGRGAVREVRRMIGGNQAVYTNLLVWEVVGNTNTSENTLPVVRLLLVVRLNEWCHIASVKHSRCFCYFLDVTNASPS